MGSFSTRGARSSPHRPSSLTFFTFSSLEYHSSTFNHSALFTSKVRWALPTHQVQNWLSLLCCCQLPPSAAADCASQRWLQLAPPPQPLFCSVTSPPPSTETGSPVLSPWIRIRLDDLLAAKGMFDFRGEAGEDCAALAWLYWNIPLNRRSPSLSEHLAATPTCVERPGMCFVSSSDWFLSNRILRARWQSLLAHTRARLLWALPRLGLTLADKSLNKPCGVFLTAQDRVPRMTLPSPYHLKCPSEKGQGSQKNLLFVPANTWR